MIPKFRAWDKVDKVIREFTAIDWSLDLVEFMHGAIERSFDDVILMQSTGLKDKNGVEIFERDIVKVSNHPFQKKEDSAGIEIDGNYLINWSEHSLTWLAGDLLLYQLKPYIEVIGNRFENPELVEVPQ
ncbi:YopX family protein [uncultured Enterococcus sp.]|mgnify:CR=1 FL=1|uniref:YopX family protein n=1 Tax=uncultured Enterococcus sp. TaxID=167972 RepID=UPI00205D93DF|nr:YopX family protein [uncultured Enterococcus sp.]DAL87419.1 MAG TPA: YopX protein [Caudoviricetes sp.]